MNRINVQVSKQDRICSPEPHNDFLRNTELGRALKSDPSLLLGLIKVLESNLIGEDVHNVRTIVDVEFDEVFNVAAGLVVAVHERVKAESVSTEARDAYRLLNNSFREICVCSKL